MCAHTAAASPRLYLFFSLIFHTRQLPCEPRSVIHTQFHTPTATRLATSSHPFPNPRSREPRMGYTQFSRVLSDVGLPLEAHVAHALFSAYKGSGSHHLSFGEFRCVEEWEAIPFLHRLWCVLVAHSLFSAYTGSGSHHLSFGELRCLEERDESTLIVLGLGLLPVTVWQCGSIRQGGVAKGGCHLGNMTLVEEGQRKDSCGGKPNEGQRGNMTLVGEAQRGTHVRCLPKWEMRPCSCDCVTPHVASIWLVSG